MAMDTNRARMALHARDEDDAPIGELVEQAIHGARELAAHEASMVLVELEEDVRGVKRAAVLSIFGAACLASSIAWAGVAIALALDLGAVGLVIFSIVAAVLGGGALFLARGTLPPTILGKSRVRIERRVAHVTESLR